MDHDQSRQSKPQGQAQGGAMDQGKTAQPPVPDRKGSPEAGPISPSGQSVEDRERLSRSRADDMSAAALAEELAEDQQSVRDAVHERDRGT